MISDYSLRVSIELERRRREKAKQFGADREKLEEDPEAWLRSFFPAAFSRPFGERHQEFWKWVWGIKSGERQRPFVAVWPRGGGKSTNTEAAVVAVGARGVRRYILYVSESQQQADDHVQNIAALLEAGKLGTIYPNFASPRMNKTGSAMAWRRNRLWTASGFVVDGMGLDSARRGAKIEDARPDLIIFDDIDGKHDGLAITEKKIKTITDSIIPAGSVDVAVLGVQNLVIDSGVFARLANVSEFEADFLTDRIISGPYPAVWDLEYKQEKDDQGNLRYVITGGTPTWEGQNLEICQHAVDTQGLSAFLRESQHQVELDGGIFSHLDFGAITIDRKEVPDLVRVAVWVDPAVTDKDTSDSMGIQVDGLGRDGKLYRLFSWEDVTSPQEVLERAIRKANEYGASSVGVETDQGGDTWHSVFNEAIAKLKKNDPGMRVPGFQQAKAGSGHGPKVERASRMVASYERDEIRHVRGTHATLERALKRFPMRKPFDLTDAAYWSWYDLLGGGRTRVSFL